MNYNFRCEKCGAEQEIEICIKDYDRLKNSQTCSKCGGALKRVIEWQGIANSSNFNGWCGKSGSSTI